MANPDMPKREGYLKHPEWLNSDIKALGEKGSTLGRLVTEGMPELLFGEEGTIPWYMSLAPGADLTDKVMEGRRPGLLDMPGPGTLGKFAMLPIAKFGAKEIRSGAARMGKNARNLDKAKNPVIERWHRTRSKNDAGIKDKGLLIGADNPNYGKNTGDEDALPIPATWLGTNPSEIPVLQYYFMNRPGEVSTYRVRIPKEEYYSTPRMKWDAGYRGDASDARIVAKGESSLTGEVGRRTGRESLIDLYGRSIPAEYLEKISNKEIRKYADKNRNLENYIDELGEDPSDYTMSKLGTMLSSEDLNWMPFLDRTDSYTKLKEVGDRVSRNVARMPNYPPSEHLRDALNYYYTPDNRGNVPIPAYGYGMFDSQTRNLQFDASRPRGKFETHTIVPKSLTEVKIPTDEQIQVGAISRGLGTPHDFILKDRLMNWDVFNDMLADGYTPARAMMKSRPDKILVDTPEGLQVHNLYTSLGGHISRGNAATDVINSKPDELLRDLKSSGVPSDIRAKRLHELMLQRSNVAGFDW
jgi:hypothetical protein